MQRATVVFAATLAFAAASGAAIDPALLAGMKARSIGPAAMSGRIAAIAAHPGDPELVYVGAATGGVWRSTNGGLTWTSIFDDQPVHSIGAVAVFAGSPDVVWVGSGEGNVRNSVSVGDGVYRSLDGGTTWEKLGLGETERISRIVLHPFDPDVAWVAALGRLWGENPERGVFKTTDGGKTWAKVLYVDEKTGVADLAIDPSNPKRLLAATWQFRRWPWSFDSGGPGSGLHLSVDGGATWKRLTDDDGLPEGELGRIGVAFAPSDPRRAYAIVEAAESAVLRSDDGGASWTKVSTDRDVTSRPFYYSDLRVDPEFPNRVYALWSLVSLSEDGGKTWDQLVRFPPIHPDHHAMWIDPADGRHLYLGNDGGVAVSRDRGATWRFVENLPVGQFYHVAVDDAEPYRIYGGLQDNGSWRGPSAIWEGGGIRNDQWQIVSFGDGFDTRPDRELADVGYSMSQEGYLVRWNLATGEERSIRPAAPEGEDLRFNWNAGLGLDPFDPATIYYGSQYLHRSTDRGETWTVISPDLTSDDPEWQKQAESGGLTPDVTGAENFTTIITIAPSPRERGVIWVGSDDGRLHVTRDGGASWTSVEKNVRGVAANSWIPHIAPSPHDPATAFVVFDDHRRSNLATYVQKTTDWGATWKSLAKAPVRGYALAVEQDPVDPSLLVLGTELGLWISKDAGGSWLPWKHGLPTASVMDLAIHPRTHDLVVATHGRSLYVLDDLRPLRELTEDTLAKPLHLYAPGEAVAHNSGRPSGVLAGGHGAYQGENRPYGAILTYSLTGTDLPHPDEKIERERKAARAKEAQAEKAKEESEEEKKPKVRIEIWQGEKKIRTFDGPAKLGLNRAVWDLSRDGFRKPERESWFPDDDSGPSVPPGAYEVVVRFGDHEARAGLAVRPDPRIPFDPATAAERWAAIESAGGRIESATAAIERIRELRADLELVLGRVKHLEAEKRIREGDDSPWSDLKDAAKKARKALDDAEKKLWNPPDSRGIPPSVDAMSDLGYALGRLTENWTSPNATDLAYVARGEKRLAEAFAAYQKAVDGEVAAFRSAVEAAGIGLFSVVAAGK